MVQGHHQKWCSISRLGTTTFFKKNILDLLARAERGRGGEEKEGAEGGRERKRANQMKR